MRSCLAQHSFGVSDSRAVNDTSKGAESLYRSVDGILHARFIRYLGPNEMDLWTKFRSQRLSTGTVQVGDYDAST
jgi:hypothetical protein